MSPLERLLQEAIPTRPHPATGRTPWSQQEQDRHWAELCEHAGTPGTERPNQTTA